jgi:hypothetical protein
LRSARDRPASSLGESRVDVSHVKSEVVGQGAAHKERAQSLLQDVGENEDGRQQACLPGENQGQYTKSIVVKNND